MLPALTLVLGGAASGKSAYAERLATDSGRARVYLATAQAYDAEMEAKIADHRAARGTDWLTVDCPFDLAAPLAARRSDEVVLLDCATMWLSNIMLVDRDIAQESQVFFTALRNSLAPVIVVSNEVGHGIVPDNALARQFRSAQGRLNQQLAAQADRVVFVTAGLPQVLKP